MSNEETNMGFTSTDAVVTIRCLSAVPVELETLLSELKEEESSEEQN